MIKKYGKLFVISFLFIPNIVMGAEYIKCDGDKTFPLALANLVSLFFTIVKIVVPILLVISGMISFLKVTFSSNVDDDMKKAKNNLVNNIIAAVIIFFVISIINFTVGLVGGASNGVMECVNCFINPDKCETFSANEELCPGYIDNDTEYDENCQPKNDDKSSSSSHTGNNNQSSSNTGNNNQSSSNTGNNNQSSSNNGQNNSSSANSSNVRAHANANNIKNNGGLFYINGIAIVNKSYRISKDCKPRPDTNTDIKLDCKESSCLRYETETAFNIMKKAAAEENISLEIVSGYRTYSQQEEYYNNYVYSYGAERANQVSARPGYSEHQAGVAIDINRADSSINNNLPDWAIWLNDNCWKYGFILRYPRGKEAETGYSYEPWHMRYVGKTIAEKLYNGGDWITLEKYLNIDSKYSD